MKSDTAPAPSRVPLLKPQASSLKPVKHSESRIPNSELVFHLSPFVSDFAPLVASWVRSAQELTWLAPGTPPPLTAEKVAAWGEDRHNRFLFWTAGENEPAGYAELNDIPNQPAHLWIGHFIIDPARRGHSLGVRFAQALLARAFTELAAKEVVLVVFPENRRAIACYERAGMVQSGHERKFFKATGAEHHFLRMSMTRSRFHRLASSGRIEARPLPFVAPALNR